MWTFRLPVTGEAELRAELRAARKEIKRRQGRILELEVERDGLIAELARVEGVATEASRSHEARIEELETVVRLREMEMRGLADVIERDRQRVTAESAVEVMKAEAAELRARHEKGGRRDAWLP